ncbi:MAG: hypothetical protein VKM92_01795 [Cyanobacteriota bacterium]|nr:hypothetical protein [Cyanobacteriota bacterium]
MATPRWVPARDVCAALGLSPHQLRQAVKRGTFQPDIHYLPGPTPNSPRRFDVEAIRHHLIELAQLRRDNGEVFPPRQHLIETFQGLAIDADGDQIELHDGSGQPPAIAALGGLQGLTALLDLLGEIQRQGRRAAGLGRPLSDAHAVAPSLGIGAGIDTTGNVVFTMSGRSLAMPLSELLQLQAALSQLLGRQLREETGRRAQLETLLAATPAATEVGHG